MVVLLALQSISQWAVCNVSICVAGSATQKVKAVRLDASGLAAPSQDRDFSSLLHILRLSVLLLSSHLQSVPAVLAVQLQVGSALHQVVQLLSPHLVPEPDFHAEKATVQCQAFDHLQALFPVCIPVSIVQACTAASMPAPSTAAP